MTVTFPNWVLREAANLCGWGDWKLSTIRLQVSSDEAFLALCRMVLKHETFSQEVSDAVEAVRLGDMRVNDLVDRFIIPKPDPLMEALQDIWSGTSEFDAMALRSALIRRGFEIREKDNG